MPKDFNHIRVILKRKKVAPKLLLVKSTDNVSCIKNENEQYRNKKDSFKNAIKLTLTLGQIICLIPLMKQFNWRCYKIYAAIVVIICQIIIALLSVLWMYRGGISVFRTGYILFFAGAAVMMMLMIRLMYMWSNLLEKWEEIELYFGHQRGLTKMFAIITIFITLFSTVEYLSNLIVGMLTTSQHTSKIMKRYSTKMFPQVFEVVHYTLWRALPIMYINSVSTLIYTFGDQIIIMISLALRNYFMMYNKDIFAIKGKNLSIKEWKKLRIKYRKLSELVYVVDDCICHLLCLTFLMHLYVICVELHQGMLYITDTNEKIHKIVTFTVSTLRACALCYATISVDEQSKKVLSVIHSTPSISYCFEAELLMLQVMRNDNVLTGSHLFSMKKKFLLTIAGTVVSYEILLLQMRDFSHSDLPGIANCVD